MKIITKQKDFDEIKSFLVNDKIYLIGCGTCATLCKTGGREEVIKMKEKLEKEGYEVVGWIVIPTACDTLTSSAIQQEQYVIAPANSILCLTCAYGVQMIRSCTSLAVYPTLDTLFIGQEFGEDYKEVCQQCGECLLGETAGICPLTSCSKGLLNGPCGGSVGGKCEISADLDCGWHLIVERLKNIGKLETLRKVIPAKDWSKSISGGPRRTKLEVES